MGTFAVGAIRPDVAAVPAGAAPRPAGSAAAAGSTDGLLAWNLTPQQQTTPPRQTAHGQGRGTAMVAGGSLFLPATPTVPALSTPPFPDHPSGHGCTSGAVLGATQAFFGTDKVALSINSSRFPGEPRSFTRISLALKEIIDARVWGGIHFRTADVQGAVIGKKVVHWMVKHYFQPVA